METKKNETFRDVIANLDEKGKRIWVHPKKPKGKFHNYRILVSIVLLGIFLAGPFIKLNGQPFLLLNFIERKFIILGKIFWPQDTQLLIFALLIFFVFILLFTVAFGRIFCGWLCPQTIFMEMVFRKVEYLIEGDRNQQIKLDKSPWTAEKIAKKTLKHFIFILITLIVSHTVMMYIVGVDQAIDNMTGSPTKHWVSFLGLTVFSILFYAVFAFVRDYVCTAICPYGRLQGVLVVKDTILVAYDWIRGEPRGKVTKNNTDQTPKGDCIDCKLCVQVCPTGIDIRNGIQLECINCTACIDVCNDVMTKINKPKGLIRYASYNEIAEKKKFVFNPRLIGYSVVLSILIGILTYLLVTRTDVETTIVRVPGMLYQKLENGNYSNLYNMQIINKTFNDTSVSFKLENSKGVIKVVGEEDGIIDVVKQGKREGTFFVELPKEEVKSGKTPIVVEVWQNNQKIDEIKTSFVGPIK